MLHIKNNVRIRDNENGKYIIKHTLRNVGIKYDNAANKAIFDNDINPYNFYRSAATYNNDFVVFSKDKILIVPFPEEDKIEDFGKTKFKVLNFDFEEIKGKVTSTTSISLIPNYKTGNLRGILLYKEGEFAAFYDKENDNIVTLPACLPALAFENYLASILSFAFYDYTGKLEINNKNNLNKINNLDDLNDLDITANVIFKGIKLPNHEVFKKESQVNLFFSSRTIHNVHGVDPNKLDLDVIVNTVTDNGYILGTVCYLPPEDDDAFETMAMINVFYVYFNDNKPKLLFKEVATVPHYRKGSFNLCEYSIKRDSFAGKIILGPYFKNYDGYYDPGIIIIEPKNNNDKIEIRQMRLATFAYKNDVSLIFLSTDNYIPKAYIFTYDDYKDYPPETFKAPLLDVEDPSISNNELYIELCKEHSNNVKEATRKWRKIINMAFENAEII